MEIRSSRTWEMLVSDSGGGLKEEEGEGNRGEGAGRLRSSLESIPSGPLFESSSCELSDLR